MISSLLNEPNIITVAASASLGIAELRGTTRCQTLAKQGKSVKPDMSEVFLHRYP
jgi:hypothetical protein